ncbi:Protein dachsous [Halotydeus destructor]|nr:Protein dachsous [Halotydeus destructor]
MVSMRTKVWPWTCCVHLVLVGLVAGSADFSYTDLNENEPIFAHSRYYASVPENATVGTSVLRATATDIDQGQAGLIGYTLYSKESGPGSGSPFFGINGKTGWIFVTRPLDYETQEVHELVVVAKDAGIVPLETSAFVSITVLNTNDNPVRLAIDLEFLSLPTIKLSFATENKEAAIAEDAKVGDLVARVSISDPDSRGKITGSADREEDRLSVSLSGADGHFALSQVNAFEFLVTVSSALDCEEKNKFNLTITASDDGQPPLVSSYSFILDIIDINDNPTFFDSSSYFTTVADGSPPGTFVYHVKAGDRDVSSAISYRLTNDQQLVDSAFAIDGHSGIITTRSRVTRDRYGSTIKLTVSASDGSSMSPVMTTVIVTISDINHGESVIGFANDPVLQVTEDCCSAGDVVMMFRVNITNGDFAIRYQVEPTNPVHFPSSPSSSSSPNGTNEHGDGDLTLDSQTGLLTLVRPFDYERKQGYKLNVSAAIYPKSQLQHVDQSAPAGGVHGHQGPSLYRAAVKVIWQLFYVQVVNTNDETPILLETEYRRLVPENCEPGTLILTIEASDPDGDDKLTYMIPDHHPTRQQFDLSSQTGELRTRAPLDRESQVVYRIPVYVFDSSRKHMTQTEVMVIVEDINESAPMFSVNNRNQAVRIPENILPSTIFHTVVASDRDLLLSSELLANPGPSGVPGHLAYRIVSGDPDNAFAIDSAKGDLWTTGHLDRERQSVYELVVEASDAHYSALCNLTVELIDIDDNVPIFAQSVYHATVNFSRATAMAAKEVEVVTVRAHDFDYGNSIYYTINVTSNKDAVYFNMDPNSGRITIAPWAAMQAHEVRSATLRDTMSRSTTLSFDVLALDIGSMYASHSSKATVHVTLTNVDSEPLPKFRSYPYAIMLDGHRSDYGLGSAIGKIEVDNMSSTSVLKMIEEQAGHRCSDFFHIDSQSGAVSVKKALNSNMYECYVAVDSSGAPAGGGHQPKPTWTLMQILFLKGTSSEMKARKATAFAVKVDLVESTPPTTRIMNLISRSKMPLLKTGQYQFHMGYSSLPDVDTYLDLQAKTGIISLKRQLDYETDPTTIELVVVAKKPNSPFDSPIYFNIAISLVNANDNPPKFTQDSYTAFVKEGEHRGTFVAHITAIDSDNLAQVIHSQLAYDVVEVRPSRGVSYHILDGNHDNAFIIDPPGSGVVKTNSVLDKEILGRYVLTIGATDDGLTSDPKSMPLSSTCTMEVNIIDLNDNAPVFPPYQEINVSEDLEVGSVVSTLTANDVDTYPLLTYFKQRADSVHDDTDDLFAVELFTGKIILKSPLRSSSKSQYKLNILASDSLHTAETQVVVKVKTGHAQSRPPPLVREHQYLLVNPLEDDCISSGGVNCELGRVDVINKNQSEELALSVIYRLSDDPSRSFYIDGHTGILYNNRSLKLVTNKLFPVTILTGYSQDGSHFVNDLLSRASLLVNVLKSDIRDDFDEYGQNFYNVEVPADKIGDVLLSFPLGTKYAYKLVSGNDANDFMLMRNNQLIRLRRSSTTEYKLEVEGTQKKGRGLKAKIIVNVTVLAQGTDLYIPKMLTVKIPDNASIGREVTSVRSDDDYLHNFKYFISAGNEFNHFHVDPNNGIITVNRQLDYDKFSHYQLVISATKSDRSELTIANVNVHILRTKDTSAARFPFSQPSIRASVDENMPIATKVIKLIDSVNPAHKFSLSETTGSRGPFALDTKSGYLVTTDIIDYESLDPPIYQLVLKSFDEEAPTKPISEVLLEIEVGSGGRICAKVLT